VVTKRRVSALHGTDLEAVLRGLGVGNLVIAGVSTSGAVLSTVREASDLDYGITVLGGLCRDLDQEVHGVLAEKVFVRQGRVVKGEEWCGEVGGKA
jgi:nicotinamidase-related amidase